MNEQDDGQASIAQRSSNEDKEAWKAYWKAQGQPWRTDEERQRYLEERRKIKPDTKQGIYPFRDIKLSRADVEWLLATHEDGRGPVDWSDESQREREGLDLRGANLCQANLASLPLARTRGGLTLADWYLATEEQRNMAAVQLQGANLRAAQLQGAKLNDAHLQEANLIEAQLQGANLIKAQDTKKPLWQIYASHR